MSEQFIVDLGTIKITEEQRKSMNAAIQKAVAGELANFNSVNKLALLPANKLTKGPIINGIIVRDLGTRFEEIANIK